MSLRYIFLAVFALILFLSVKPKYGMIHLLFAGLILVSIISLFKAVNVTESLYEILKLVVMLAILLTLPQILEEKDLVIKSVILIALIMGIWSLREYFTVIFAHRNGLMSNRNLWSAAHMMMLPFCLYGLKYKIFRYISLAAMALMLFGIITLLTRSVLVSLTISAIITLVVFKIRPNWKFTLTILLFVVLFFIGAARKKDLTNRIFNKDSYIYRTESWLKTLEMSKDNLLFGVGIGNWRIVAPSYGIDYSNRRNEIFFMRSHNDPFGFLSETGIFGFVLYISIFVTALYYARSSPLWFFGILCYMGFAFFSFPKERAFHTLILILYLALVIPKDKFIKSSKFQMLIVIVLIVAIDVFVVRFKTEVMMKKVITAWDKKDWNSVVELIDDGYSKLSTLDNFVGCPILFYKAEAYLNLRQLELSFRNFKKSYSLNPNHIYVLNCLGCAYSIRKDWDNAESCFRRALEIYPNFKPAQDNLDYLEITEK